MLSFSAGTISFDPKQCSQCGACISSCFQGALSVGTLHDGIFPILVDPAACTLCKRCVRVCPISELPNRPLTEQHWLECHDVWLGWSLDRIRRSNSSSGGVARTLIEQALAVGYCDVAWCVSRSVKGGQAHGTLFRKEDDLSLICNSMYEPVLAMAGIPAIPRGTRMLAVGTNCQLQALDKLLGGRANITKVALLCKQQKTAKFGVFLRRMLKAESTAEIQYRGSGWPGLSRIGTSKIEYDRIAALPFGRGLWRLPGCATCNNPIGFGADITLADPWGITGFATPKEGSTLMLIRTRQGEDLMSACKKGLGLIRVPIDLAKTSMNWESIKAKHRRLAFYLGTERSRLRRFAYATGEGQRHLYEKLLERLQLPEWCLRVLNRLPFLG